MRQKISRLFHTYGRQKEKHLCTYRGLMVKNMKECLPFVNRKVNTNFTL